MFAKPDMTLMMHMATFQKRGLRAKIMVAREILLGLVSVRMSPIRSDAQCGLVQL
jgi:hypothetical protein